MEYRQEPEVQSLLKDIVIIKARISKLLVQARQGLVTIQVRKEAKKEVARQNQEIEEQKEKISKLDAWLETINTELKESTQQSDVLTEDNILRYIEIYERYIREYEEYEIILKSISVAIRDDSSQVKEKVIVTKNTLEETRNLVINEIERLREILLQLKSAPEAIEEDISQTDRTIDSTSMPEEVATPREDVVDTKLEKQQIIEEPFIQESNITQVETEIKEPITKVIETETVETQTGKSLKSDSISVTDKSVICQPEPISTHDVSITCAPPKEIEVQTSEPTSTEKELLENIQIRKTISDGHETIEIASKPVYREFKADEKSLVVGADYTETDAQKDSKLNITHSLPQSFETVMVEPDETTTEVVVDADGTKRIIVKKVRKTLVTRQQVIHSQQQKTELLSSEALQPEQSFSQITMTGDKGYSTVMLDDGATQKTQYQTYGAQVISGLPSGEVTIQEFTSKPDMVISLEKGMNPDEILQIAEGEVKPHIETSSSSVTAVVQQVTKRIVRTRRRFIRKVVIIDGKEHVTEEVVEEPDSVEISEEQIPRVSINVRDDGSTLYAPESDDKGDDDQNKPFDHGHEENKHEPLEKTDDWPDKQDPHPSSDDIRHIQTFETVTTLPTDIKEDTALYFKGKGGQFEPMDVKKTSDLKNVMEEFIQNEGRVEHKQQPTAETTSADIVYSDRNVVDRDGKELQPAEYTISGSSDSTLESSFMNVSSVIQKVTRKITRTKKRIIKHIKIVDGKEYVTEEVIEEPDDVEVIEEEPKISHTLQQQGVRTKRIRIIKQVQIIDGKEHVSEQVIEDSGDEYEPTTTITTEIETGIVTEPDKYQDFENEGIVTLPLEKQQDKIENLPTEISKDSIKHVIETDKDQITEKICEKPEEFVIIDRQPEDSTELLTQEEPKEQAKGSPSESNRVSKSLELAQPENVLFTKTVTGTLQVDDKSSIATKNLIEEEQKINDIVEKPIESKEHITDKVKKQISENLEEFEIIENQPEVNIMLPTEDKLEQQTNIVINESHSVTKPLHLIDPNDILLTKKTVIETPQTSVDNKSSIIITKSLIEEERKIKDIVDKPIDSESTEKEQKQISSDKYLEPEQKSVESDIIDVPSNINTTSIPPATSVPVQKIEVLQNIETEYNDQELLSELRVPEHTVPGKKEGIIEIDTKNVFMDLPSQSEDNQIQKVQDPSLSRETGMSILDITKSLIVSETDHSALYNTSIKKSPLLSEQVDNIEQIELKPKEIIDFPEPTLSKPEETIKREKITQESLKTEECDTDKNVDESEKTIQEDKNEKYTEMNIPSDTKSETPDELLSDKKTIQEPKSYSLDTKEVKDVDDKPKRIHQPDELKQESDTVIEQYVVQEPSEIINYPVQSNTENVLQIVTKKKKVIKRIEIIDGKEHITEQVIDESDEPKDVDDLQPEELNQESNRIIEQYVVQEPSEVTNYPVQSNVENIVQIVTKKKKVIKRIEIIDGKEHITEQVIDEPDEPKGIDNLQPDEIKQESNRVIEEYVVQEPSEVTNYPLQSDFEKVLRIVRKKKKVIRRIEIIDGKEHVTEEVIEEPEDIVETEDDPAFAQVLQQEGLKTRRIKIIRQIKIIDGKEHVTQKVIEEPGDEFIPETTVTAEIDVSLSKPEAIEGVKLGPSKDEITTGDVFEQNVHKDEQLIKGTDSNRANISHITTSFIENESIHQGYDSKVTTTKELEVKPAEPSNDAKVMAPEEPKMSEIRTQKEKTEEVSLDAVSPKKTLQETSETTDKDKSGKTFVDQLTSKERQDNVLVITEVNQNLPDNVPTNTIIKEGEAKVSKKIDLMTTDNLMIDRSINKEKSQEFISEESLIKSVPLDKKIKDQDVTVDALETIKQSELVSREEIKNETQDITKPFEKVPILEEVEKTLITDVKPDMHKPDTKIGQSVVTQEPSKTPVPQIDHEISTRTKPADGAPGADKETKSESSIVLEKYSDMKEKITDSEDVKGKLKLEPIPHPSPVKYEPPEAESSISIAETKLSPEVPEVSYITQFAPKDNLVAEDQAMFMSEVTPDKVNVVSPSDIIRSNNMFIDAERQNIHIDNIQTSANLAQKITQTELLPAEPIKSSEKVDITMTINKVDSKAEMAPTVGVNMSIERFDSQEPLLVKKDIQAHLPSEVKVTQEVTKNASDDIASIKESITEVIATDTEKEELIKDADKSVIDTESSSLSHYVELPVSTPIESPKPTLLETLEDQPSQPESSIDEQIKSVEERGYEPEGTSIESTTPQKIKKQKKRKSHQISEETLYPIETPTENDNVTPTSSAEPVEPIVEKKVKARKGKKKVTSPVVSKESEIAQQSPVSGHEVTTMSPKEESYHTMSETSDISTVKVVEECVGSSPDLIKDEIATTVTYPVPVVEEIPTQEYSIQTSPEISEVEKQEPEPLFKPETNDTDLQTSPIPVSEVFIQTTPVEDKEADTQTSENIKCIERVEVFDTHVQTSRTESPEQKLQSEATTQVIPRDISLPGEKSSQTTPSIEKVDVPTVETSSREIQTSPLPKVQSDEKSTEMFIQTIDSTIQTITQENTDQETSITPVEPLELADISIQTFDVPKTSTFTQSDVSGVPLDTNVPVSKEEKYTLCEVVETSDIMQQTSPRSIDETTTHVETPRKEVTTVSTMQQTTPRVDEDERKFVSPDALSESAKVTVEFSQQTTPREHVTEAPLVHKEFDKPVTVDSVQQTTPRSYIDDSISTSTDEPYEIHLRAQISIPQATNDFLDSERQTTEYPQTILGDKHKQRKRKPKRKAESPLKSPESLSDPINAELSLSVTPTSDDLSSKDSYSLDEGISQYPTSIPTSQETLVMQSKPTYSDVVQRSKSKSPSPVKTLIQPKTEKAKLLNSLQKRTQATYEPQRVSEDSMAIALIEPSVEKSYEVVVNSKLDEVKNAVENKDPQKIEKSIIVVIETISIWLEEIQYKIHGDISTGVKVTDEANKVKDLEKYVQYLKEIVYETEIHEEIVTLIETLTRQMNAVSHLSNESVTKVKESEEEWLNFLKEIEQLIQTVNRMKSRLEELIMLEVPTSQKLEGLDKIENDNSDVANNVKKMFKQYRVFAENSTKKECPSKLYLCDEDTKQIENAIHMERDRLLQLASLAEEYEQTLQDFGQITDVAEALLDGKIIVSDLDHLHEEIQKHRKFFVNLSHCRAILESLEDNLDNETRAKYASLHHLLHDRATSIIDRAAGRAQQMTLAASRWSLLDQGMKEELQWLRVAEQRIPDLTNVTSMDHEQYINLYQSLSLDVSHHYAKILRLLSITEGLQNLIFCPGLESECSVALDTLLKHQENIDGSLIRLTDFKENWLTYDHLINRIEGWIKLANREMESITPENITTTSNLRRFWELKAQHEVHNNLKNECGVQFEKALEILPISDEMVQRQFFSKTEDKWRDLSARIGNLHASAIQNISDRGVTSGEKLNLLEDEIRELRGALEGLKGVIKSEDELNLYIERLQVMTGRIDRIQNELGRLSLLPTAESERLGALLSQSGILDDQIAEELERSMLLKEKIIQVQAGIGRVQKGQRRARLTLEECETAERLGSDVVERASQNCERLLEDLSSQWKDILALRQALHTLPISLRICVSPTSIERDISALQESHAELEAACNDLSVRLRNKLQLWRRFERQLELVQGAVREADYMVELLTVQGQVDYDRLLKATERLETLSDSLSRRSGELVGELRDTAAPLEATTEPSVAAKLKRQLDDAAAAYEHTCANLTQLCDKYHKAVDLWSRYREAAAAVRAFAESQEGSLHALRPDDAPATAHACLEQEARVAELRSLAARVAAETGSRALQADADALARRLQLVAGAVQALADLGEARQIARAKAQHAKEMFCDMRQDLTPVHEDGEIVEDKLIALRDNLIALGKSEADIAPAKAELPDIDRDVSDEHSIVRILELWQAMFRDTFLHYHRLSTALVRSGDAATAFKLWHEYLLDLQSFLSSSVPADYENLTEHRRLCRVHKNLLASQRSVLINENRETNNRDLADKFDTLTNLHNETLAKIVDRHDEVSTRIAAWDDYKEIYTELLRWLKELEREKEKLQLRYVHIKRINKTLTQVQNLSDKLPEGRKFTEKLFSNLKKVLEFTEDTYGASVRMEYAGIVKRVDNLQASLDTWRDFLTRILGLISEYETLTGDLQKLYSKTQNEIINHSDEERLSKPQIKKAIDKFTDLRTKIDKTESQIEALSVIQEQLKECLSPQDIRIVNQKVWQLRQQRADLEHQLSIIIHRLQERIEIYTIFDSRLIRFSEWLKSVESRLESTTSSEVGALDPHDLIKRINSDIQAETGMKEREFEWLVETGASLVELSKKDEKSYSKNTSKQLKDIQERWHSLQECRRIRITKISELLETISQLEERLTEIRTKLHTIESKLSASVVLEHLTTKAVDTKFQSRDEIHKDIENESEEVGKTLNLCELVFNDPDVLKGNFDLRNLRTGVDIVDKKWKNICEMSEQRKTALKEIRKSAELANSLLPKVEKKLDSIEKRVEKVEARKQRGENEDESVSKAIIKDLDNLENDVKKLEDAYSRVVSARGIELRGTGADDAGRLRASVRRWQQLKVRVDAAGADAHRQFVAAHGKAVVALAEADVRLTRALHLSPTPTDTEATLKELEGVERDVQECESYVEDADRLATSVMSVAGVPDMVAEYRALYADVRTRLDIARAEVVGDVDTAVQVNTLKWETDAALQIDTLTSKETYRVELASAVKEASEALEALRTALIHEIPENAPSEELANAAKEIAKAGTKPSQTLELAKHLSELLLTECDATEDEAMLKQVESLSLRYEDLLSQAKKRELQINNLRLPHSASYALTCEHESGRLTCPLCSDRNWKQLDNDLWRLEQWLQFAEATHEARHEPPEQYDALEDTIQDHREFLLDLDSHKALVVSLNVVGSHVARHARDAQAADRVRERLADANRRWDAACARAADWQTKLQRALMHNREFHDIVIELVDQLGKAEAVVRSREPLRLSRAAPELRAEFRRFSELRDELSRAEPRVLALRDAAQLLHGHDAQDVCRRLGELRLRLQSLRKLSAVYALKLGAALANQPAATGSALAAAAATLAPQLMQEDEEPSFSLPPLTDNGVPTSEETEERSLSGVQRGLRFVCRVARASLPFQALLLLLLGAAALAPHTQTDCRAAPSLQPVLRYPDGPPPI